MRQDLSALFVFSQWTGNVLLLGSQTISLRHNIHPRRGKTNLIQLVNQLQSKLGYQCFLSFFPKHRECRITWVLDYLLKKKSIMKKSHTTSRLALVKNKWVYHVLDRRPIIKMIPIPFCEMLLNTAEILQSHMFSYNLPATSRKRASFFDQVSIGHKKFTDQWYNSLQTSSYFTYLLLQVTYNYCVPSHIFHIILGTQARRAWAKKM